MIHKGALASVPGDGISEVDLNSAVVDQALARLGAALGVLEAAASRRLEAERSKSSLETELALMQDDRARLAVELDGALARAGRLDATVEELARRIDRAIRQVRGVLDGEAADLPDET